MNQVSTFHAKSILAISVSMFVVNGFSAVTSAYAETWTSLRGTQSVEADMVGLWGNQIVLALRDGRRVSISLDDLRAESRIQAQRLSDSQNATRSARINELRAQADSAASPPAPETLPMPSPAEPYVQPDPASGSAKSFRAIDEQLRSGHAIAIFDCLPPSYQQDLEELTKLAAAKTNESTWRSLVASFHKLGKVIVERQGWFFSHPRLDVSRSGKPGKTERMNETILSLAGILRAGADPERFELSKLQSTPLREWLLERDAAIAPYLAEVFQRSSAAAPTITSKKEKGKTVAIKIATERGDKGPVTMTVSIKKVDDVWVPESIVDAWSTVVPETKKELEAVEDGSLMSDATSAVLLSSLESLISPLEQAESQDDFHAAMQPLLDVAVPMLESFQSNLRSKR